MENNLEKIDENLSFEELSNTIKTALASMYIKLHNERGFTCHMHCSVVSIGPNDYDVELVITENSHSGEGEQYISTYWI